MSYFTPKVDKSGYSYPSYQDILADLVESVQKICGTDVYLGSDSMDYQLISIFALKIFDAYQAVEIAYNAHSPATAIGTALDYIVAINGISRAQGTKSKAMLTLQGTAGTPVSNGIVADINGVLWDLPTEVVIGSDGTVTVEAVCRETGITVAEPNTITRIMTPAIGWISVTNTESATTGTFTETDSALRARQILAVAAASQSILSGLRGALLALNGVTRVEVLENDTNQNNTASGGLPAHSICCIVEGGEDAEIAQTILNHKSCGCATYGTETETIKDTTGQTYNIKFSRPSQVEIDAQIDITVIDGAGYSEAAVNEIQTKIIDYLSTYSIGKSFVTSMLWSVVQGVNASQTAPSFFITAIKAAKHGQSLSTANIPLAYYEYAHGTPENIVVNVTYPN